MSRQLIVAVHPLTAEHRARIRAAAQARGLTALFFDREEDALPAAEQAEILFTPSPALARSAQRLRWLCTPFAGIDAFTDPTIFAGRNVILSNSSGAYGVAMAEHIVMVTLMLLRRQGEYARITADKGWRRDLAIRSIFGSRITIVGTGDVGAAAARRLRAFSPARLVGVNRRGGNPEGLFDAVLTGDQIEKALPETDLLILCLPGTRDTRQLLTEARLSLLPEGAALVNVGRGSAVDQDALERELLSGRLCAALDVFQREPLPPDSPLWDCPRLLITPHVAGNMLLPHTVDRVVDLFLEDLDNYCAGRPLLRQVDPARGY